jgi:hypothetical protein
MYVCVCQCMCVCMYVCMYVCVYVCMYVCVYVCMYVCVYVCMYVCMYVCVYVSVSFLYTSKESDMNFVLCASSRPHFVLCAFSLTSLRFVWLSCVLLTLIGGDYFAGPLTRFDIPLFWHTTAGVSPEYTWQVSVCGVWCECVWCVVCECGGWGVWVGCVGRVV